MKKLLTVLGVAAIAVTLSSTPAQAWSITVGGSTLSGDDNNPFVFTWTFGGSDHLFQEVYLVDLGPGGGQIAGVDPSGPVLTDTDGNGVIDTVGQTYNLPGGAGTMTAIHTLSFGDSPEWSTSFSFNAGPALMFYIYADYDLSGSTNDTSVTWANANAVVQLDPLTTLSWRTATPGSTCAALLSAVANCAAQVLAGGALNNSTSAGPGDVAFAAQYGRQTFSVDRSLSIVPEPASMILLGSGLLGLAARARARRRK
jgi:PEP-CTERM motif